MSQHYEIVKRTPLTTGVALSKSQDYPTKSRRLFESITRLMVLSFILVIAMVGFASAAGPAPVDLGSAGDFVILSKTGITNVPTSAITGNIGTSPISGTAIGLTAAQVTGKMYAVDVAGPTGSIMDPTKLTAAISAMQTAYSDAAGRTLPTATELGDGNIGGLTFTPGLYKWGTGVNIPTDVTLSGGPNDIWIFQIAQGLTVASGKRVILSGGAQAKNVFWQIGSSAEIGTGAKFNGNILAKTAINLRTGASLNGRALSQTAVTLQSNAVTNPGTASSGSTVIKTPTPVVTSTPVKTPTTVKTPTPVVTSTPVKTPTAVKTPTSVVTSTPVKTPTAVKTPTSVVTSTPVKTPTPTETPASPLPIVGILAGLCIAIGFRIKNS